MDIVYYHKSTKESTELFESFSKNIRLKSNNPPINLMEVNPDHENPFAFLFNCLQADLLIFDASIEDEIGSNFRIMNEFPSSMDHIVIVSRNPPPINFQAMNLIGPRTPNFSIANSEILTALADMIQSLLVRRVIPRNKTKKLENQHKTKRKEIQLLAEMIMKESFERNLELQKSILNVFISYRSKYFTEKVGGISIGELKSIISDSRGIPEDRIYIFEPGSVSSELMTEQRRWRTVSLIDRKIRLCDEFWIFSTPDYRDSWWTQAELISLSYMKNSAALPKIIQFDPIERNAIEIQPEDAMIPNLTELERREIARRFANAESGYESAAMMRLLKKTPKFVQGLNYAISMGIARIVYSKESETGKIARDITYSDYRKSIDSPVYDASFWETLLVECNICRKQANSSVQSFLRLDESNGFFKLVRDEFDQVAATGKWKCPRCSTEFLLSNPTSAHSNAEDKSYCYQWWPVRMGKATGPNGCFVEKIRSYTLR